MIGFPLRLPLDPAKPRRITVLCRRDGSRTATVEILDDQEEAAMRAMAQGRPVAVPVAQPVPGKGAA